MRLLVLLMAALLLPTPPATAVPAQPPPIPQRFLQEVSRSYATGAGIPPGPVQLIDISPAGVVRALQDGKWWRFEGTGWVVAQGMEGSDASQLIFSGPGDRPARAAIDSRSVTQILRSGDRVWLVTSVDLMEWQASGSVQSLGWPGRHRVNQAAISPEGVPHLATSAGLFLRKGQAWERIEAKDSVGRVWTSDDVRGVAFDGSGRLWFATLAGVGSGGAGGWRFFEGRDGLPYNDFTGIAAGAGGEVWFGTRIGLVRLQGQDWHYRQGPRWLAGDQVRQIALDLQGNAWISTEAGISAIARQPMTLHEKARHYEAEIERYVKRTPYGFVSEAYLRKPADRSSADPQDSDNDGLWTSMYGAGECFGYAATGDPIFLERARKAFDAMRFLQKVTQGGSHSPDKGFIARSIRSVDLPDPNVGGLEADRRGQQHDRLWKAYEPRWPRSADGKWFWKSDTSSDELDGHYFFYALYHDLCARDEAEKERVREVVRDVTDHLIRNDFLLVDHDGKPTRWGVFGPAQLNRNPTWWPERGLNSLSMLAYLSVAHHVTGDEKYGRAIKSLVEDHGYAHNAMYAKVQHGPGSGNQSDDEMAVMGYYTLLRCSRDEGLKRMIRHSFFSYWANESPEMNPFFNFAYASQGIGQEGSNPFGGFSLAPWKGWLEDSQATLQGFPLDRLDWPHRNSHRIDIVRLGRQQSRDLESPDRRPRGHRVGGRVLPVENRHFGHWNTDPWELDYGGSGHELGAGTVFLLPYYMGLYHGYIEKPQ